MNVKHELLYVLLQPEPQNSYWADQIRSGIREAAREGRDSIVNLSLSARMPELEGRCVLVVGNQIQWLEAAVAQLLEREALPVVVNAALLPVGQFRCSGVLFELEEILGRCIELLAASGRRRTALVGVSTGSLTDHLKAEAFQRAAIGFCEGDVFWAPGRLDECVARFVEGLEQTDYDAAICANDTVAISLLHQMEERGYALPGRLYVIGMGNSYVGAGLRIGLTSVMFDYHEMGMTAVRLCHSLCQSRTACHMTVSLPCRLVVRDSAPLTAAPEHRAARMSGEWEQPTYFGGGDVQNIIRVESILQAGDPIDREILFGLVRGESCERLSERLYISARAVRYRLTRLIRQYGFSSRVELEAALKKACRPHAAEGQGPE